MRWGKGNDRDADGVFNSDNDYYCERTFAAMYSHKYTRAALQKLLSGPGQDETIRREFMEQRNGFIEAKKAGSRKGFTDAAMRDKQVESVKDCTKRFVKPKGKFYPMKLYREKFGDPKSKKHRALGHTITMAHGVLGVEVMNQDEDEASRGGR